MKPDKHNLFCAFVGFLLLGIAGFALSGGFTGVDGSQCPDRVTYSRAQVDGAPAALAD